MNNKGQLGFAFLLIFFILVLFAFATIEPFKEVLNNIRGADQLNCPGTPDFNETAYNEQDSDSQLSRRPTCFVTGISMVWYIGAILVAGVTWVTRNWRKIKR